MELDITSIIKNIGASIGFEMTERLEDLDSIGTVTFTSPVTVKGKATSFNAMIEVEGEAQIDFKTVCDRCGETIERHITVPIRENIVESGEERQDAGTDEEDRFTYSGHVIILDRMVADAILLSLPMQQLCSEDCKGLCPSCGKKLTGLPCDCGGDQAIDPRLESLKGFFNQ
ncbi:MAG TPA: DUF177 domain-containing protein [Thermoclostridium caenicola]|uniref:DUF177 domain-containing protein n=1 Tax=Thermoclostridium caenicola TaxID=659425 RepID=A0A1M6KFV8_9FIRM|nr:DUF177 domain-containing protein [Thermoclostridium caenicola]SHJ57732.1 uncharacterized protein SAMN05444373_10783 [Thermoclostridium caenicola]HOK44262.1 DUF177 domain-containing protein [Thermoclostridium caenicola]HPO77978.1 DUF177 domain-containing protein [Thermoclostridium caenicola]HPU22317.1 DUF177 domain-containing protein [Thermoclostridium caenicola]